MRKNELFELPEGTVVAYDDSPFLLITRIRGPLNKRGWLTTRGGTDFLQGSTSPLWSNDPIDFGRIRVVALPAVEADEQRP